MAYAGPTPIIRGGTPTTAAVTNLPKTGSPSRFATLLRANKTAAAPSETWDALPAWVDPSLAKAGLSFASDSLVTPSRTPSSASTITSLSSSVLGSFHFVRTGTISDLKLPAF